MTYLVDASALSEPAKARLDSRVVAWLIAHEGDSVVDSIVLGELSFGILALPKGRKRVQFEEWFNAVASAIECLPWDAAVSLRWAGLLVECSSTEKRQPSGLIRASRF
jgi:predicted nucleic acid-binding protein